MLDFTRCNGHEHPQLQLALSNHQRLLVGLGRTAAAIHTEIEKLRAEAISDLAGG